MKKKLLLIIFVVGTLFLVTGCGNKKVDDINYESNNTNGTGEVKENDDSSAYDDFELYSDNTKIVFANGSGKIVFYYSGNEITAHHVYFDYNNNAAAKLALQYLEKDESIDKAYVKGRYLIVEYNKSEYENMTLEDVKTAYSYLEELKKNK